MMNARQGAGVPGGGASGRWRGAGIAAAALLLLLLGACSGKDAPEIRDESGLAWVARGSRCVRESEEGPVRRVINRTDPELCGIVVKRRPSVYVRVVPPPGMRSR